MGSKITLSKKVEVYLRNKILNGELQPNDKIVELEVAKEMDVSRGPVRDALKTLMFEGLVDYKTNKGCSVRTLSPKDAYEIFFIRGSLEKIALERCGGHFSGEAIFKMDIALERMKKACEENSLTAIIAADEMFHYQIVNMGGISLLTKMWQMLSPLNGAMFLTVKRAQKLGADVFQAPCDNKYAVSHKNNYEAHKAIFNVLKEGGLENSCLCLDAHYAIMGEKIYRVNLREEASKNSMNSYSIPQL
ncbi:MAG: GntR family transcriptional regulator [Dethiosulfovibrio peptidovorans]|nr:MAG: GntR family transcriptional regulator [Dethiosulfovibrio peptidovorans]